jgi:zinc protease
MENGRMNVTEYEKGTMRFFAARTGAKDVVSIVGSVLGGHFMLDRVNQMVPRIATSLLDAGTRTKDKDTIRDSLAARGATIYFSPGGDRTYFNASCLPDDIEFVLKLITECMSGAVFPAAEISLQKKRTVAELMEAKIDTGTRSTQEFLRMIYDPSHVNYPDSIETSIKQTNAIDRKQALAFQRLLGKGGLVCAITGDIRPDEVLKKAERAFSKLPEGTTSMAAKRTNIKVQTKKEECISIPDKANIDVSLGVSIPLTYDSPEYIPLTVFTNMLGGSGLSSGHLMRTVRERDGLTYGIYANPVGFGGGADGALRISATFSPATFDTAVSTTRKEIQNFLSKGLTDTALEAKKAEMTGKYVVGLATSRGLAGILHMIGVEEKPLAYIDEYPSLINAVTVADLKKVAALIPFDKLSLSAAGTFQTKK